MAASNPRVRHAHAQFSAQIESVDDSSSAALALLGKRVRALRAEAGLTQAALAESIGMSRFAVISLESGKHDIGASKLPVLAKALGLEVADLFQLDPNQIPG